MHGNPQDVIRLLQLQPLQIEGGWFHETYRSTRSITVDDRGTRSLATAIYYLLTPETFSEIHRLPGDEIFHFYLGDPVEMLHLHADLSVERITLGQDLIAGQRLQVVVPGGVWQGARLVPGGRFALMGTTMFPGFSNDDYESGDRGKLIAQYTDAAAEIEALTKPGA
jgi:predicted cupin superfamily sugar epimerase